MRLECNCGKRYRVADRECPACGGTLRPAQEPARPLPAGGVDVQVLLRQKEALRDELRVRDRQLRQAMNRIRSLELHRTEARAAVTPVVERPANPPTSAGPAWAAAELPSDRLELPSLGAALEQGAFRGALELPSDRVPLFEEEAPRA